MMEIELNIPYFLHKNGLPFLLMHHNRIIHRWECGKRKYYFEKRKFCSCIMSNLD